MKTLKNTKILVTSALPYANGPIHIGHLVEYIQTDIFVRFLKSAGFDAFYCCADDTHGAPIEINAKKAGVTPEKFIEKWHKEHLKDFTSFGIEFDSYYSTHSPENKHYTELIFSRLQKKGLIYTKVMELTYCESCKRFLPDRYVKGTCPKCGAQDQYGDVCEKCNSTYTTIDLIDPFCTICKSQPIRKESEHYFFKLSEFSGKLKEWLQNNENLQPEIKNQILNWIKEGLEDWCISRDGPYFGFKIPNSDDKYFYVWLDAPIGYIASTANYCKDKDFTADDIWQKPGNQIIHFIGKDIIYFHLLFWPAVLMSADFSVPDNIVVHGFLTVNNEKMSKSRGTFLTAKEFLEHADPELLRFYYAANLTHSMTDIDLDLGNFVERINNELVSNIANFGYRVLSFTNKKFDSKLSKIENKELLETVYNKSKEVYSDYQNYNFRDAIKKIMEISSIGNKYFQDNAPWELVKENPKKTQTVLTESANILRVLALLLKPVMPIFSKKIETQLDTVITWKNIEEPLTNHTIGKAEIILKKIDPIELETKQQIVKKDIKFKIDPKLSDLGIKVKLAKIYGVNIKKSNSALEKEKKKFADTVKAKDYKNNKIINAFNAIYKEFGLDVTSPMSHLISLIKEKGKLPTINTVVDAYNIVAVDKLVSVGVHDLDRVEGNVKLKITDGSEVYIPLGEKQTVKLNKGEFALSDDKHVMCYLDVKQGQHTKIGFNSNSLLVYVQGNKETSDEYLEESLKQIVDKIIKYNGGEYELIENTSVLNLKAAKILEVEEHPKADKLLKIQIDLGTEQKQICAGLKPYYPNFKELESRIIAVVANLKPANLRGERSEGMLLAADDGKTVEVLSADIFKPGDQILIGDQKPNQNQITFDEFIKLKLENKNHQIYCDNVLIKGLRSINIKDSKVR